MQTIFWISSAILLFAAINVVTRKNLVHAALFLILAFLGVAVLFVLLEAGFWAVMQILIYIGAIAILMIFAVMLTPQVTEDDGQPFNRNSRIAGWTATLTFSMLVVILGGWNGIWAKAPEGVAEIGTAVEDLGLAFFTGDGENGFLIPSLLASVLLLGGFIAALVVAMPASDDKEEAN